MPSPLTLGEDISTSGLLEFGQKTWTGDFQIFSQWPQLPDLSRHRVSLSMSETQIVSQRLIKIAEEAFRQVETNKQQ